MASQPLPYQHGLHRTPIRVQGHRAHFNQPQDKANNNKILGRPRATTNNGGVRNATCTTPIQPKRTAEFVGTHGTHSMFTLQHNANQRAKEKAKATKEKAKDSSSHKRVPQLRTNF